MKITKAKRAQPPESRTNPYSGGERHPEIERIIKEGNQRRQETQPSPTGEQDDGGADEGEDDDIWSGRDYGVPAGCVCGNRPPPLLKSTSPGGARPIPLGSALPPFSGGAAVATASGGDGNDRSTSGIYDGLAKLAPNTIIDKNQLASMFGVSEKTIRRRIDAGELPLPHMKMRRNPQWFVGLLLDWLKDRAMRIAGQEDARRQHIRDKTE